MFGNVFWRIFHQTPMIQNWVQMKGTDANVSCTKFEWIWKTWLFKLYLALRFGFMIGWLLNLDEKFMDPKWIKKWFSLTQNLSLPTWQFDALTEFMTGQNCKFFLQRSKQRSYLLVGSTCSSSNQVLDAKLWDIQTWKQK